MSDSFYYQENRDKGGEMKALNRFGKLFLLSFMAASLLFLFSGCDDSDGGCAKPVEEPSLVETTRDDKGVWFITGPEDADMYDVFEAMGYAVATDRLWQAETFRRTARGRLSEIFGPGEGDEFLMTDAFMRTIGYSDEEIDEGFANLSGEARDLVHGYVAGFNRRIAEIRSDASLLPFEFKAVGQQLGTDFYPEDWTYTDVLAWVALMLRNFDPEGFSEFPVQVENLMLYQYLMARFPGTYGQMFNDLRWINDPDALTYIQPQARSAKAAAAVDYTSAMESIASRNKSIVSTLKKINAYVKMGSYAWVVSGDRTQSGNPIVYSGPQMDFSVPAIVMEGSVRAGGLNISGMTIAGLPGIVIGRTPHHAWSMQVGHAHTVDYYFETPETVHLHRVETIHVAGGEDILLPVYRSSHGPVVNPLPYSPFDYVPDPENPIVSWKYAHWGYEFETLQAYLDLARAESMDEFGQGIDKVAVSQHFCYADKDGNIAYWMSGRDPVRPPGEYRLPQGVMPGVIPVGEWDRENLIPKATERNPAKGYFGGWNNKAAPDYVNSSNNYSYIFGPFHRAHVVDEYLSTHDTLSYEEVRDLAFNISLTDSFDFGGNPYAFVDDLFEQAVANHPTAARTQALGLLEGWDGHFIQGTKEDKISGTTRSDAWVLADTWIREVLRLTFMDELGPNLYAIEDKTILFNVFLHSLPQYTGITNTYNWFTNTVEPDAPQDPESIIVTALDIVLADMGAPPWNVPRALTGERDREIGFEHEMLGTLHETPFSSRSTYAHCVEMGQNGPVRIESMFPLGQSGTILMNAAGQPVFDPNFFSMAMDATGNPILFDRFDHRSFPLFE